MTRIAEHAAGDASLSTASRCACAAKAEGTCGCAKKPDQPVRAFGAAPGRAAVADAHGVRSRLGDGRALPTSVRSRMEGALGHDFSRVRVHADGAAQRAAGELGARAFAVGNDVAFGAGDWRPGTPVGDAILAHELSHVAQQSSGTGNASESALEHDADVAATGAVTSLYGAGTTARPALRSGLRLQRCGGGQQTAQGAAAPSSSGSSFSCPAGGRTTEAPRQAPGSRNDLDQQGQALATYAASAPPATVGVGLVTRIICAYFPDRASLVAGVRWDAGIYDRLDVDLVGTGPATRATIIVGNRFVEDVRAGKLARAVLSVDHELYHVQQVRGQLGPGLAGDERAVKDEREFLAYHRTATQQAIAGTGRYSYGERLAATRAALGYYNCLSGTKQTQYAAMRAELLRQYAELQPRTDSTAPPPTDCQRGSQPRARRP